MIARKGTVVKVFKILRWGEHFEVVPDQHGRTDGQKRQYCSGQEPAAQTAHRRHGGIAGLLCGAVRALHRIHDSDIREETAMKLKDKKIEILAVPSVINENGYPKERLEPVCPPVWAYFRHLSGREDHAANAEQVQEEALFQINRRAGLSTAHVIRFKGMLWDITRVDTVEGYREDMTLYCKRRK